MITKFKRFTGDITYDDAILIANCERNIKNYFMEKYGKMITDTETPIFSFRKEFSETSFNKIVKFAKKNNDKELQALIDNYLNVINNLEIRRNANKYNI